MAQASTADAERELVFTRVFDAPREVVFDAFAKPEHLKHWWGPFGFTTTVQEMDVRPGGEWRLIMHGPDGRDYHNRLVFIEVAAPERLVYRHEPEPGSEPVHHEVTVTFKTEGLRTRLMMRMVFPTAEQRDFVVKTYRADEGGRQTLDRLAGHLAERARRDVVLTRVFAAPRELVWKVWTDPRHVAMWWGPRGSVNPICEWDLRQGGKFRIEMHCTDGECYPMSGEFEEVSPPERIVFLVRILGDEGVAVEVRNTVTFAGRAGGQTALTLETHVTEVKPSGLAMLTGTEVGWTQSFERMETELEAMCKSS